MKSKNSDLPLSYRGKISYGRVASSTTIIGRGWDGENVLHRNAGKMTVSPGGRLFPYLGYTGTYRWVGHGFLASLS